MAKLQYTICGGRGILCVVEFDSDYPVDSPRIIETFRESEREEAEKFLAETGVSQDEKP